MHNVKKNYDLETGRAQLLCVLSYLLWCSVPDFSNRIHVNKLDHLHWMHGGFSCACQAWLLCHVIQRYRVTQHTSEQQQQQLSNTAAMHYTGIQCVQPVTPENVQNTEVHLPSNLCCACSQIYLIRWIKLLFMLVFYNISFSATLIVLFVVFSQAIGLLCKIQLILESFQCIPL